MRTPRQYSIIMALFFKLRSILFFTGELNDSISVEAQCMNAVDSQSRLLRATASSR